MKALFWTGIDSVEVRETANPVTDTERDIIVRVRYNGVCGSDLTIMSGKHPRARSPLILGHEFMGTVETIPSSVETKLKEGQRVVVEPLLSCGTCRPCLNGNAHVCENLRLIGVETDGGCAEFVTVPHTKAYPVPDSVTDEHAALSEPLAVAVHAVSATEIRPDDTAVVIGAGPIGLLVAMVARAEGVSDIVISELNQSRLARARALGFDTIDAGAQDTVAEVLRRTYGKGASAVFDAAGVPGVCDQIIPMTAIKGRITLVAIHKKPCEILFQQLSYREQVISGTRIYAAGDFQKALDLMAGGALNLDSIVTHVFDLVDAAEALRAAQPDQESCKVLIRLNPPVSP